MRLSALAIGILIILTALLIGIAYDANIAHLRTTQLDLYIPRAAARLVSRGTRGAYSFQIGSPVFSGRGMWSRRHGLYLVEYVNDAWREYVLTPDGEFYVNHGEGWNTDIPAQRREDLLAVIDFAHLTRMDKLKDSLAIDWFGAGDRTQWDGIKESPSGYSYYDIHWAHHPRLSLPPRSVILAGHSYTEDMHFYSVEVGTDILRSWSVMTAAGSGYRGIVGFFFNPEADLALFPDVGGR